MLGSLTLIYFLRGLVLFCESRILTYFHGGIRKFSVISTDLGHKNSNGNGNIIILEGWKTEIINKIVTDIGNHRS